jgi:acyl dehydratase
VGGLAGTALFQTGCSREKEIETEVKKEQITEEVAENGWEFYYPNKYDAKDAEVLEEFQGVFEKIRNWGDIDINDVISGKLNNENAPVVSWNPMENNFKVTLDNMMSQANAYVGDLSLFTDREHAKKTRYGDLIAFPLVLTLEVMPAMPKDKGIGDYMVVSAHNDVINFYKPIYEGDTLFTVYDEQHCIDITPEAGSHYRTFAMSGSGRTYNQKGELVAEGANILKESFRRHRDPEKRNPDGKHAWESPDWWSRKPHVYTDEDWEYIKSIWKNEKVRGAAPLYWDEVNIGDEIIAAHGPLLVEEEMDMMYFLPQWAIDTKKNVLDPKTFSKMVKNKQGIYVLPEHLEKKPSPTPPTGAGGETATPELANRDGRAVVQNAVLPKFVAGMIYNWMGEQGWLQRIGWDIMELPPGYPESVIPLIPMELRPALVDKYPYMKKVPYMRGCRAAWHALEGDIIISKAYVTDKYRQGNDYFADLTWWCRTLDKYLVEEGFATVKLPKK